MPAAASESPTVRLFALIVSFTFVAHGGGAERRASRRGMPREAEIVRGLVSQMFRVCDTEDWTRVQTPRVTVRPGTLPTERHGALCRVTPIKPDNFMAFADAARPAKGGMVLFPFPCSSRRSLCHFLFRPSSLSLSRQRARRARRPRRVERRPSPALAMSFRRASRSLRPRKVFSSPRKER